MTLRPNDYDRNGDIIPMSWKEEKGDLISREYIRKALNEAFGCENATKYGNENAEQQAKSYSTLMLYEIADIVEDVCDNAPTVEERSYAMGYQDGLEGIRPQGEWLVKDGLAECNKCHHLFSFFGNFCSNCGAEMFSESEVK